MSLTDELRRMIGAEKDAYTLAGTTYWTDDQLDEEIAKSAIAQAGLPVSLSVVTTYAGTKSILFGELPGVGFIDPDDEGTLTDRSNEDVEASVSLHGAVAFTADVYDAKPIFWAGTSYDLHGAAAIILTGWLAYASQGYDVTLDGQTLRRSQAVEALEKRRDYHRGQAVGDIAGGGIGSIETSAPLW